VAGPDDDLHASGVGGGLHRAASGQVERHRLFHQDVLAGLRRGDRQLGVGLVGSGDVDEFDLRVGEEPGSGLVGPPTELGGEGGPGVGA
jgi:hypothetical protein